MRTLVWFRADLRIHDHPALADARRRGDDGTVAAFILCPRQWRMHEVSDARVDLVLRTLRRLSKALADLNVALRILDAGDYTEVPDALLDLAREHGCDALHFNAEYEVNERRRDEAVERAFVAAGRGVSIHHDQCILEPGTVLTREGSPYSVFSPFKRNMLAQLREHGVPDAVPAPERASAMVGEPDDVPASVDGFEPPAESIRSLWPEGEDEASRRLERFLEERALEYDEARDFAAADATSRLSPYLATGCISARTCLRAAKEANNGHLSSGAKGLDVWISELAWRDFYRHVLVGWPRVSMHRAFRLETEAIEWSDDEERFEAWCEGRTGYPIVDAGMRQLRAEAWMHNRLRMIVAMFLTKDLFIDWRKGERHFMRHLIDGDLASNNGGWQWSASTGTDAQPYFRIFNPTTQGQRYDPEGDFVRRHVPELRELKGGKVHEPWRNAGLFDGQPEYPKPIVDHGEAREHALAAFKALD